MTSPTKSVNPALNFPGPLAEVASILTRAGIAHSLEIGEDNKCGELVFDQDAASAVDFGGLRHWLQPWPSVVEEIAPGVQRLVFPNSWRRYNHVGYWGEPAALVSAGIASPRQVARSGSRWAKGHSESSVGGWNVAFAPSGSVLFSRWDEEDNEYRRAHLATKARLQIAKDAIRKGEQLPISTDERPYWKEWFGHRADLIAAGICREEHFPPRPKRQLGGREDELAETIRRDGVELWGTELVVADYYRHHVSFENAVVRRRELDAVPPRPRGPEYSSLDDFAEHSEDIFSRMVYLPLGILDGSTEERAHGETTMRYDEGAISKIRSALDHAVQLLQSAMPHVVQRQQRESHALAREAGRQSQAAKADDAFQTFMRNATSPPT